MPIILDWIRLQGQRAGLYGTELGLVLYATGIVVFAVVVWLNARSMNVESRTYLINAFSAVGSSEHYFQ
jgi:hypothetical protein